MELVSDSLASRKQKEAETNTKIVDLFKDVRITIQLDTVVHGGRRTRGATVRKIQGVGNSTFVLSIENDNDFRSRCE